MFDANNRKYSKTYDQSDSVAADIHSIGFFSLFPFCIKQINMQRDSVCTKNEDKACVLRSGAILNKTYIIITYTVVPLG